MKSKLILFSILISQFFAIAQDKPDFEKSLNIMVFSRTKGFRHASISSGIKMLYDESKKQNWVITTTEDPSILTDAVCSKIDVAVFLNPTGDALNDSEQAAFEKWIGGKKGFVGIHAAADCEYEWQFYANLIGAHFKTHPPMQKATVLFENFDHPAMLPFKGMDSYTTIDEWYTFKVNPRANVKVLATLDETTIKKYDNENWKMGDHPIIWWNEKNGIRSFYSGFGHTDESFQDKKIIEHLRNAINWAGKRIN